MHTKLKTLKTDIDRFYHELKRPYPMVKMISSNLEEVFKKDMEDDLLRYWYDSLKPFILEIRREIKLLKKQDDENKERLKRLKYHMDEYEKELSLDDKDFFSIVYTFVNFILSHDRILHNPELWYKGIRSSLEIMEEKIEKLKR